MLVGSYQLLSDDLIYVNHSGKFEFSKPHESVQSFSDLTECNVLSNLVDVYKHIMDCLLILPGEINPFDSWEWA